MKMLEVNELSKYFVNAKDPAVDRVSFDLNIGEIMALVGPSGCGKTSTLRLIAGLDRPDCGWIRINGQLVQSDVVHVPVERRGVGMVFQDHALFPHLSVSDNVAFGLRGRKRSDVRERVGEMLALVGLESMVKRYPHELSGGERQRVALARALAPKPALILMDEPFSSLDSDLRSEVREQVRAILKRIQASVVFVTHDQDEALYIGDRLAVMRSGRIEQIGGPEEIFHSSKTRFVAEFLGASDFLTGEALPDIIRTEIGPLPQTARTDQSGQVEVAVRADDVDFDFSAETNAVIVERFFRGAFNLYRLQLPSGRLVHSYKDHTEIFPVGSHVRAFIRAKHPLVVFRNGSSIQPMQGDPVDEIALHGRTSSRDSRLTF